MITVINNLTSTSTSNALSANMGRVLNEAIEAMELRITSLEEGEGGSFDGTKYVTKIWE